MIVGFLVQTCLYTEFGQLSLSAQRLQLLAHFTVQCRVHYQIRPAYWPAPSKAEQVSAAELVAVFKVLPRRLVVLASLVCDITNVSTCR